MPRYRRTERRWIHAACVAGAYLVLVAGFFTLELDLGVSLPVSVAVAAPPLVYAALAMLLLREAMFVRRISWVGSACVVHLALATLAAIELTWAGGLSFGRALAQVFVLFPPGPVLTLVATPLTLAAFGLTNSPPGRRAEELPRPPTPLVAPAPLSAGPKAFPRPLHARKNVSEADAQAAPAPRAGTLQASTSMAPAAAPLLRPSAPATPAGPATVAAAPLPASVDAAAPASPPVSRTKPTRRADDMVRVSFARIASQLPAEAFVLPFERLSESLREPHVLFVPRRVVLSQMRGDAVAISWAHIASQFPDLALGMSDEEFRKQYPDLTLWLPMDEVTPQLPASEHARTEPPLPLMSPPINGATTAPVPSARASAPVMPSAPVPSAALVSREVLSQIVGCFSGVGSFESAVEHVAGSTIVSLIEPSLPREAVTTCAGHLLRCLAGASAEIVTLRTRHAVVVLAVAPTPIVSAARLPGAPVALLGMRALRAAASVVDGTLSLPTPPQRALELVSIDGQRAEVARTLRSFGAVATTVFAEGTTRVYVASTGGGDDKALAALALNVCDALGDGGALGRPRAIVFRRGGQHTLVRPLTGRAGVLVVAGPVTRPGRLLGESDRAATVLEAL